MYNSEDEFRTISRRLKVTADLKQGGNADRINAANTNIMRRLRKDGPCGHVLCKDKYTCGHKCCKYTLDWAAAARNQRGWLQSKEAFFIRCFDWTHKLPQPHRDDPSWDFEEPEYEWFKPEEWLEDAKEDEAAADEDSELGQLMDRIRALTVEQIRIRKESTHLWGLVYKRLGR